MKQADHPTAFDDIAMNDIEWGSTAVDWSENGADSEKIQWHVRSYLPNDLGCPLISFSLAVARPSLCTEPSRSQIV